MSSDFVVGPSLFHLIMKTAFLLSLAMGSRVSELHALLRDDGFINFNGGSVTLFPNPNFLCKNENQSCCRTPFVIAGLLQEDGTPPPVCPVRTLKSYLAATTASHSFQVLFIMFIYLIFLLINLDGICFI